MDVDKSLLVDLQISATNKLMEALVASEKGMRERVELLNEILFELDSQGRLLFVNSAWQKITGLKDSPLSKHLSDFFYFEDQDILDLNFKNEIPSSLLKKSYKIRFNHATGNVLWVELSLSHMGKNFVGVIRDVTQHHKDQEEMRFLAHYDPLTKLPNRTLFLDRLTQAMTICDRKNQSLALAFVDLDNFKKINDTHGHIVGDKVLIHISNVIQAALRKGDSLSRISGDEFIVLLNDLDEINESSIILERILAVTSKPFIVDQASIQLSCSIGVNFYPKDSSNQEVLIRHADQAMYLAKQSGKNSIQYFDTKTHYSFRVKKEASSNILNAIKRNELEIYFQPKIQLSDLQIAGAEVLSRWNHPIKGLMLPGEFLPYIENDQVSIEHGKWVIKSCFDQLNRWNMIGCKHRIFINIGAYHLQSNNLMSFIKDLIKEFPEVSPTQIGFEILETSAFEDSLATSQLINELRAYGFMFAIDDFGTGYSSLTFLKHLEVDFIKIDQSFIFDMLTNSDDMAIVKSVLALSKVFNRKVIAEGVETIEHLKVLTNLGCDYAQGYLFAKPMTVSDFENWCDNFDRIKQSWI
jgi:diguanylate cyclase (GGDEF)-like protein/PAS domain S-box-containing protein